MSQLFAVLSELQVIAGPAIALAEAGTLATPGPWRPSEWRGPAPVSISVPATPGTTTSATVPAQFYVFDAVLKANHKRELRRTRHPIQTSATSPVTSIADHAFKEPTTMTVEIGMSDAMDSYAPGMWTSNPSKSVSAFQTLCNLQDAKTLVTVTTRLATYGNMLVEVIEPSETVKTLHGLKATVVFSQVFLAQLSALELANGGTGSASGTSGSGATNLDSNVTLTGNSGFSETSSGSNVLSARPQTTDATPSGTQSLAAVPAAITSQHAVTPTPGIPGAGGWSSANVGSN
jgi:hypothetical protein